jgi:uncharacterized membrane protein YfcA
MEKIATIFLFLVVNGTWALMAYLLHSSGLSTRPIAIVLAIGVLLGNLAVYAGITLAARMRRKDGAANSTETLPRDLLR